MGGNGAGGFRRLIDSILSHGRRCLRQPHSGGRGYGVEDFSSSHAIDLPDLLYLGLKLRDFGLVDLLYLGLKLQGFGLVDLLSLGLKLEGLSLVDLHWTVWDLLSALFDFVCCAATVS